VSDGANGEQRIGKSFRSLFAGRHSPSSVRRFGRITRGRFGRFVTESTLGGLSRPSRRKFFFTSRSVCLTHCRASFPGRCPGTRQSRRAPTRKNCSARKPLYYRCFLRVEKNSAERRAFSRCNVSHAPFAFVETQDVGAPRTCACSIKRKCWCFCSAVVIGRAVFAIPAGTVRHRHSLMARRAAWRRSEGK